MKRTALIAALIAALAATCLPHAAAGQSDAAAPPAVIIPAGHKFIMELETSLHTRTTRKGDRVEFRTAADVLVDDQIVIPNHSLVRGTVVKAKRAGRLFGRAEIQLRFDEVQLPDGTVLPLQASITRMGFDPVDGKPGEDPKLEGEAGAGGELKTVAGGAAQGGLVGVIYGGARGGMYGAAAGAAVSAAQIALQRGPDLDLPRSTMFEAQFNAPLEVPGTVLQAVRNLPPPPPEVPVEETQVSMRSDPAEADETDPEIAATRPVLKRRQNAPAETVDPQVPPAEAEPEPAPDPPVRASAEPLPETPGIPTIGRVSVRMVQVDAVVRDRRGRMLENLTAEDFLVYEDGVLQQIETFSRDELPLAVALVVDRSGSVSPFISELRRIATQALNQLKPEDKVCLFSFADKAERIEDLTINRRRIADGLNRIRTGGGTNISDALYEAVTYLARAAPGQRHAVILISDNQQTVNPQASDYETVRKAMETETVLYSLKTSGGAIPLAGQLPALLSSGPNLSRMTQETGGELISVGSVSSLDSALASVIARLRMRYSFGYYPSGTGQGGMFHEIKVRLTDRHGKPGTDYFMHAKRGYYATGPSTASAR